MSQGIEQSFLLIAIPAEKGKIEQKSKMFQCGGEAAFIYCQPIKSIKLS